MKINLLLQKPADDLMKSLEGQYLANFVEAFHEERYKSRDQCWALPNDTRLYYQVESYLFGINCQNLTALSLSSFARIDATSPKRSCATCLKYLIEKELIPLCKAQHKKQITARLVTGGGSAVFKQLESMMPRVRHGLIELDDHIPSNG